MVGLRGVHLPLVGGGLALALTIGGAMIMRDSANAEVRESVATREAAAPGAARSPGAERTPTAMAGRQVSPVAASTRTPLADYGRTIRVHLGPGGRQADGSVVGRPALSADGRFVAFASLARNLAPGDRNRGTDVFVRDRLTRRTILVSATPQGRPGSGPSSEPALSADGRWVAFESWAPDLIAGPNRLSDDGTGVFLRDLRTGRTELISAAPRGRADGNSEVPAVSADGSRVAFHSLATNLVPGDGNGHSDVFVWTRGSGLDRVSRDSLGAELPGGSGAPALSADGSRVAFVTAGTRGGTCEDVHLKDLTTGVLSVVSLSGGCGRFSEVALSGDGRHVAYSTSWPMTPEDADWTPDVYVRDIAAARTSLVSGSRPGTPKKLERGSSYAPALSHDGRWVAFTSFATDLLAHDRTREQDAYLRDLRTGRLTRIATSVGTPNGATYGAVLSPDAAHLAFGAGAENLIPTDNNHADDVFVIDRGGPRYPVDGLRPTRDRAAPNTEVDLGPDRFVHRGMQRFGLWADETAVHFQCMLDGAGWRPCSADFRRWVGPGTHVFQARAVDAAGNADQSPASRVFTAR